MKPSTQSNPKTSSEIRRRIDRGGERIWRYDDFQDLPFEAVAQTLSRLTRKGLIERLSKGVYYRPRETAFGKSKPNPVALQRLARQKKAMFPAGVAAANLLGFTTQTAAASSLSTSSMSVPRKLLGTDAIVHTLRPAAWRQLSQEDAALLEFLRDRGSHSELSPAETIRRTILLLRENRRFSRIMQAAGTEPPRVRAMLGALGLEARMDTTALRKLRESLNRLSKFDFGVFAGLRHARSWQAKPVRSSI